VIRPATPQDAADLAAIYNPYIEKTIITFEEQAITPADIAQRVTEVQSAELPWLVAEIGGRVVGYAYASKWKGRCAYRYSVESTVYLNESQTGKGLGTQLYRALLNELAGRKIHAVIGGIALPNEASVKLHERLGFKKVAHFPEVGFKFGRWVDVGYWQLTSGA